MSSSIRSLRFPALFLGLALLCWSQLRADEGGARTTADRLQALTPSLLDALQRGWLAQSCPPRASVLRVPGQVFAPRAAQAPSPPQA